MCNNTHMRARIRMYFDCPKMSKNFLGDKGPNP